MRFQLRGGSILSRKDVVCAGFRVQATSIGDGQPNSGSARRLTIPNACSLMIYELNNRHLKLVDNYATCRANRMRASKC